MRNLPADPAAAEELRQAIRAALPATHEAFLRPERGATERSNAWLPTTIDWVRGEDCSLLNRRQGLRGEQRRGTNGLNPEQGPQR